ncbi:MAG: CHAT domain-containing protein [Polynucleobacter sp.]|nr:CHAT domain-containing protein [Polynucleobacter sp.]
MKKKKISDQQAAFIESELKHGDSKARKVALQNLSALYRQGGVLGVEWITTVEAQIVSLLLVIGQDRKVVRWGLNALAQCGRWTTCQRYIESTLTMYSGDPEIEAAGAAALCKLLPSHTDQIDGLSKIDPRLWKLAALQTTDPRRIDLRGLKINVERDDEEILKLALITIGVNRDIENLFDPRHSNGTFVRELCAHDDPIVQQYSVWAVTENARLDLEHLGLSFDDIDGLRPNVQSKMYQLAAQRLPDFRRRLDLIVQGSYAESSEARVGLAKGVRRVFFDGLEAATLPWFEQETDRGIRGNLAEHIAAYASECGPYLDVAQQSFEEDAGLRARILLGAEGTSFYGQLKSRQEPDLFSRIGDEGELTRMLRAAGEAKSVTKKTVCMLMAAPRDEKPLRLDEEVRDALQRLKLVEERRVDIELRSEWAVKLSEMTDHLLNAKPQIVHFSGHGGAGAIFLENEAGEAVPLSADGLAGIIDAVGNIECVILNACNSADLGAATKQYVKIVIGCDDTIADDAAITFTRSFYRSLAHGRDYRQSFKLAVADVNAQHGAIEAKKYKILF